MSKSQSLLWISHSYFLREVEIEAFLVNLAPLRVGAGREPPLESSVDLAVLRIPIGGKSVPYIPGSSLKGVFRSVSTQFSRMKGLQVCNGLPGDTCMDYKFTDLGDETLLKHVQELLKEGDKVGALKIFNEKACLMCKIFGAPSFSSHVEFSDAYPVNDKGEVVEVPVGVRTGVAINRRTGAAQRGALYEVEYVEPGARFRFKLKSTNLPNYALGVLAKTLRMLDEGLVRIGGFKTRGFGLVKIENPVFLARGLTVKENKLLPVEEGDIEVDLSGLATTAGGWLRAENESAWKVLERLESVWDSWRKP